MFAVGGARAGTYIDTSEVPQWRTEMPAQLEDKHRHDLILRLKRVEGQLRGLQKMIDAGEDCEKVGQQMAASRKALDRAFYRMVGCMLVHQAGKDPFRVNEVTNMLARLA
jgi:DNA-binding FrmR family transcriptional regulator